MSNRSTHSSRSLGFKIGYVLVGLLIMSVGSSTLRVAGLGVDPFTAFNLGVSQMLGSSLGETQLISNIIVFVIVFAADKRSFGLGSLMNMVLVGYFIQFFSMVLQPMHLGDSFLKQLLALVIGVLIFTLGATMYMTANMGQAPYDAVAPILSRALNRPYQKVRSTQDIITVIVAFFLGGPVGVGTIICAFGTGPLVSMWKSILPDMD